MTDHSPDHAERAGALRVLAAVTERMAPAGKYVARDILDDNLSPDNERAIAAMLDYADERVAAALRARDTVVEADAAALDAILLRWRLNSDAARPSVKLGLLRRLRAALGERS